MLPVGLSRENEKKMSNCISVFLCDDTYIQCVYNATINLLTERLNFIPDDEWKESHQ